MTIKPISWRSPLSAPPIAALTYLFSLTLAEVLTVWLSPQIGMLYHLLFLLFILIHAAIIWRRSGCELLLGLAFIPLIRIVSLSLPLAGLPLLYWYLVTSVPLFSAVLVTSRLINLPRFQNSLKLEGWLLQLLISLTGIGLGAIEYYILRPAPLIDSFTWTRFWGAALILLVCTGYVEELIFRWLLQHVAVRQLGRLTGITYVSFLFAVLHFGYQSMADVLFVFVVGLSFGLIVDLTGSILGVTLAHGLTNISLFLIFPFLTVNSASLIPAARLQETSAISHPIPFITAEDLPLRAGPHTDYPLVATIQRGALSQILGCDESGGWLLVLDQTSETSGWTWSAKVSVSGSQDAMPILQAPQFSLNGFETESSLRAYGGWLLGFGLGSLGLIALRWKRED